MPNKNKTRHVPNAKADIASRRAVLERRREAQARQRKLIQTSAIAILAIAVIIVVVYVATTTLKIGAGKPTPDLIMTAIAQSSASTAAAGQTSATAAGTSLAYGGPTPALVGTRTYASAPPMLIDTTKKYTATVSMAKGGQFMIQLYPDKAPITVNSFVFLARQGFFDGLTFHRVLAGFMAQGGDPTGTGGGGPGYQFVNENSDLKFDKAGVVAMANGGPNTNGSQFFITFAPYETGNGSYTIFGQVTSGMDVVSGITLRDPDTNPTFSGDVIQSITISEQ